MKKILPIYPWPVYPSVQKILDAHPNIQAVEALPGGPWPVLAIKQAPPWACDAIVVMEQHRLMDAVHIALKDGLELVTVAAQLSELLGTEVKEVTV